MCSKKLRGEGGGRGQSPFLGEKRNRVRGLEIHERPTKKPAFQKSSRKKNGLAYFEGGPRTRRSPPSLSTIVAVVLIFPRPIVEKRRQKQDGNFTFLRVGQVFILIGMDNYQ